MSETIDTSQMMSLEDLAVSDHEDAPQLKALGAEAAEFLLAHRWCRAVKQGCLDRAWPDFLAVIYFEIEPDQTADYRLWVVVGDLPPAYLDVEHCPNGATALDAYVGAMQEWVDHARQGKPVEHLIPVRRRGSLSLIPSTVEIADELDRRLKRIDEAILPEFAEELSE